MQKEIEYVRGVRRSILHALRGFSNKQLNEIPHGFHNNLIWHVAHMIASQQDLFYIRNGFDLKMEPALYSNFRIGTHPSGPASDADIDTIKSLALSSIYQLQADFDKGQFKGVPQLDDVLTHFIFHEGMHMAYILSIRRLLIYKIDHG